MNATFGRRGPPLAALRRVVTTRPTPLAGERCEMCAEPIGAEHQHVVNLESRGLHVHLPRLLPVVHGGRRRAALPGRAGSLPVVSRLPAGRPPVRRAGDPGRTGVLVPKLGAGPRRRVLSGSGRGDRVGAAARRLDAHRRAQPRARRPAARRRGAADPRLRPRRLHRRDAQRVLLPSGADRHLLRAGRPVAAALAGFRRRHRGPAGHGGVLRRRGRPGPPGATSHSTTARAR